MNVTHLESALDGTPYEADTLQTMHEGRPLWVRYDLDAVRESEGCAVDLDETRIREWMQLGASTTGVSVGPEAAVCVGAAEKLGSEGWIAPDDRLVLFNCGAAHKCPQTLDLDLPRLSPDDSVDWDRVRTETTN